MTNNSSTSGKLAVILHADVAGSTALVRMDEHLAHSRMQDAFRRFEQVISDYQGELIELRGDALLARFDRVSDAVSAALTFQLKQTQTSSGYPDDIRPGIRIGIALGEVVLADRTVTGAGVVLAQRMEQLAEPGGVCVTPAVREALPDRMPFDLDSLGEQDIKGFDEAFSVYRVTLRQGEPIPQPQHVAQPVRKRKRGYSLALAGIVMAGFVIVAGYFLLTDRPAIDIEETTGVVNLRAGKPSIAVLPFDNLSGDPEQEYFADGVTEDLTTDLSKIKGLFVVARNSAFAYKGQSYDMRQVALELGVRYLVEGSVRRIGNQVRFNAQLIDGDSGGHLWAERFDGSMADIFALQDSVNRKIVEALKVTLTEDDEARFDVVETSVPEAYDLMLKGVERYNEFSRESIDEARELFKQAAELDSSYARAYANIALTYATQVNFYWAEDKEQHIRNGLEYADQAVKLDDSIPQIYMTRSILYLSQRKHQAALEAAQRTVEVHPGYADGLATLAFITSYMGKYDQSLKAMEQAKQLNPQGTGIYLSMEGRVHFLMGDNENALRILEESVERNPGLDATHLHLAATYAELGQLDDAAWSIEEALAISPDLSQTTLREEHLYMRDEDFNRYLDAVIEAGLPE